MVLIGHSYGAAVAAGYLGAHPEHVARVVLSSPPAARPGRHQQRSRQHPARRRAAVRALSKAARPAGATRLRTPPGQPGCRPQLPRRPRGRCAQRRRRRGPPRCIAPVSRPGRRCAVPASTRCSTRSRPPPRPTRSAPAAAGPHHVGTDPRHRPCVSGRPAAPRSSVRGRRTAQRLRRSAVAVETSMLSARTPR
ncbi:alpha/beta fold hydrolase [Pseudonocardia asaccharolytica]|uniref:alpha/beta fold hydrolase n=1 Tax=Pseudonocardia asaccharolytica TaxID=54010 RepID=UPI0011BF2A7D